MLPLKLRFCGSQIVIIMNFVVVLSVGIKRVVCRIHLKHFIETPLMSKHNICFHGEIRKILILFLSEERALSGAINYREQYRVDS